MAALAAMVTIDEERCKGCGLCIKVCNPKVLALSESRYNSRGYAPIEVGEGCTGCELCYRMCPDLVFEVYRAKR